MVLVALNLVPCSVDSYNRAISQLQGQASQASTAAAQVQAYETAKQDLAEKTGQLHDRTQSLANDSVTDLTDAHDRDCTYPWTSTDNA